MDKKESIKYMHQALRLARKGAGRVAPNPMVGAVIVKGGEVIGKGWHKKFGQAHAEVNALTDCQKKGNDPRGSTMFVTLEPCCHHGKTGPCTEAIFEAGIGCVEIATLDDCPLVAGKGAGWLEEKGIQVKIGCCEHQARRLNAGFFKLQKTGQPQVILKWAESIDGKLAWPAGSERRWLTNEKSRAHVHEIRSQCGAILVGIGTVLADDPMLNVRLAHSKPQPVRVVLDSRLRIPLDCQLVRSAKQQPVIVYALLSEVHHQRDKVWALVEQGCEVVEMSEKEGCINLSAMLADLGKRGVTDLLVEGGATILHAFMKEDLADKVMAYIAPIIIGEDKNVPPINFTSQLHTLTDISIRSFDEDVLIEGYLDR
jgi:diaminohydroxyphosphoribosylaminopyrimidine deaminase/5-amino-6-(5-phosphoribosylamino)uracil reductase